jgi:hypothetical protein
MTGPHTRADDAEREARRIATALNLSEGATTRAVQAARLAVLEYPINRRPDSVAAGAVYYAGLMQNDRRPQRVVADAASVSEVTIRDTYREIADCEGLDLSSGSDETTRGSDSSSTRSVEAKSSSLWSRYVPSLVSLAVVLLLTGGVLTLLPSSTITVEGEPVTIPPADPLAAAPVIVMIAVIWAAVQVVPPMGPGGGRRG